MGQPSRGNATLTTASQGPAATQLNMENHGDNQELDIEEIIKAAREAAVTHSKDWILKQIRGDGASEVPTQEEHTGDRQSDAARNEEEPPSKSKKRQGNASRGARKGDKKEADKLPEAGAPGPSKRAKANNDEQISVIVEECLKSMSPLVFARPGEIQVEGLDLTTVDKKEEERRERNRVRKEMNFDNWLDAFRIMACIIVDNFPHCANDLWLYESKIHMAQRQFTGDA
ncbi:hypothetical protein NDU88_004797 [Pleurodeles waltl]|uniref:Uncharacterized protein n=1 Tax=Pleurodeles waltl TaxID=8319 RepID=A0AAV7PF35_PLEWA|nr:hypothetical protein NDU88_004797 [Pleurodeles waltl]